ncbi:TonB-dependent receptor [Vulcaniibacterium tengchongense]|uniref:Catecholate siderophore receptor n=1 Tax=Vulcaniibacterium tengchongense TaxID=1273429 RepID=A0A3N4V2P9_9GAMM|nr:TonB-dependent siderophore receptor [Vulcaniibacterium tengchongense]RPE77252.1 catecholate siderophore receptor [Vulcaniibacterium tengchongense]
MSNRTFVVAPLAGALSLALGTTAWAEPAGEPMQATDLDKIEVHGHKVDRASSPKITAPLLDTPRSITVIPAQVLRETGSTTLVEALRTVPGITFGAGEGGNPQGDRPFIRGFDSQNSIYVDGVRDPGAQSRESFAVERVEVIKGPTSAIGGRGAAGGAINLASKLPQASTFFAGTAGIGTDHYLRGTVDANVALSDDTALRVNVMSHDADVPGRDEVGGNRFGFAPSISFGMNGTTKATLSYYHLKTSETPDAGIPYQYSNANRPADVAEFHPVYGGDRDNFYGLLARDFRKTQADIGTATIEHAFGNGLSFRNVTRYGRTRQDYILSQPDDSQGNVVNGLVWRRSNSRAGNTKTFSNQSDLFGSFETGGIRHDFSAGIELGDERSYRDSYVIGTIPAAVACRQLGPGAPSHYNCTTLADPDPRDPWVSGSYNAATGTFTPVPIRRALNPTVTEGDTRAAYLFDTVNFGERWLLNAGLRYDDYSVKSTAAGVSVENDSDFLSYQLGLVWKPVRFGSVYVSVATSSTPAGAMLGEGTETNPVTAASLEPEETRNRELGTKWDLLDERLSLTAAVFRTEKKNVRVQVTPGVYELAGDNRVDGVELGVSGRFTPAWQVFAGYTYMDSEVVDDGPLAANDGKRFPNTPKNSFSLWSSYAVTPKLSVGGGAFYVDKVYGDVANLRYVPDYWRFDAMASYAFSDRFSLRLNLQNLTDEIYYDRAYASHFAVMAPGRSATMTAEFKF